MIVNGKHYDGTAVCPDGYRVILTVEGFDLPIGTSVDIDDEDTENGRCVYYDRVVRSIDGNTVTCTYSTQEDRIEAQTMYTALMTDTLIEEV